MIEQVIEIRAGSSGIPARIEAVQVDSGRKLKCFLTDMTIPEGAVARIYGEKPSKLEIYNDCEISGNQVIVELTTQFLAEIGTVACQVEITHEGKKVTSFDLFVVVKKSRVSGSAIESTNEFTALEEALRDAKGAAYSAVSEYIENNGLTTGVTEEQAKQIEENKENISKLSGDIATAGAGAHNSIYRGKNLGTSVTATQYAAIKAGTFDDMYIGDYWVIGGVTYRIAAFDYYYRTGDTSCDTHHVTLVPDGSMYAHCMNDTNITTGAYVGSKMYTEGLNQAKETINTAFGAAHILNHRQYLQNAVTDGYTSGSSWYDSTVELMTEQNCYGGKVFGNCQNGTALPNSYTVDKSQYPLFAFRPNMISNRAWFWLRDVVSAVYFAGVSGYGFATYAVASDALGVRPAFSIIG